MENRLAENIRRCRKDLGLTQDQLAERLGVTLGAVSKWERGSSVPDLGFIMDLAELFHISVDALIGFSMHGTDADGEADRLDDMTVTVPVETLAEEYEKALKKFPNHLRIVCGAAASHRQIGVLYRKDHELKRALELYRHGLELLSRNTDPKITAIDIRNEIAGCYAELKDYKRAVEEYKKGNLCGNNNARIGLVMIQYMKKPEEGIEFVEKAFGNAFVDFSAIMCAYQFYYFDTRDYVRGLRAAEWSIRYFQSLKEDPGKRSFVDKIISLHFLSLAVIKDMSGDTAGSEEDLQTAFRIARNFDADPVFTLENMVFLDHMEKVSFYDDSGPTAVDGLRNMLEEMGSFPSEAFREKFEREIRNPS